MLLSRDHPVLRGLYYCLERITRTQVAGHSRFPFLVENSEPFCASCEVKQITLLYTTFSSRSGFGM